MNNNTQTHKVSQREIISKDLQRNWSLYLLVLPVLVFYFFFAYKPMYGAIIAFKQYSPGVGIMKSPWIGFENFIYFFSNPDFGRILKNTLVLSCTLIVFGFPAPIILALLINEIKNTRFSKATQTIAYMPHFISLVVVCGLVKIFVADGGVISKIAVAFGAQANGSMLNTPKYFLPIYVLSDIWQGVGWGSIIYIAALSGIDKSLYEAAEVDGAGKWKQLLHVTLPGIESTIVIMLILRLGKVFSIGFEKIILLYNPLIYETSDVISSYVYRMGFESQDWSYSTAVGLFNSVVNFSIVILSNYISRKATSTSLW